MRLFYAPTSLAFAHRLRFALDREDIAYFHADADTSMAGLASPMTGVVARLYLLDDADQDRAQAVLAELLAEETPRPPAAPPRKPLPVGVVIAAVVVIVFLVGLALIH